MFTVSDKKVKTTKKKDRQVFSKTIYKTQHCMWKTNANVYNVRIRSNKQISTNNIQYKK